MKRNMRLVQYAVAGLLVILLFFWIPFGNQTAHAPEETTPSYLVSVQEEKETKTEQKEEPPSWAPPETPAIAPPDDRLRFLLLGTDEREDEPSRSDTIILASYTPTEGTMRLLSIPRDTKVWIPGQPAPDKINAAHAYGGMDLIKQTVESWSGLNIDHVAKVNFNGFEELVDGVGGVTVSPARAFSYGGDDFSLGKQTIDGKEALNYVRFRKDQDGDFGRIKRQQEVVQNTLSAVLSDFSLTALPSYLSFYLEHVKTDMSILELTNVAKLAHEHGLKMEAMTLETHSTKNNGIWFEETTPQKAHEALSWLENQNSEEVISTSTDVVSPSRAKASNRVSGVQEIR